MGGNKLNNQVQSLGYETFTNIFTLTLNVHAALVHLRATPPTYQTRQSQVQKS